MKLDPRSLITTLEPGLEYVVTATLIVSDVPRSIAFYRHVLDAEVLGAGNPEPGKPAVLRLGDIWLTINVGGGPTDDKPEVIATPPTHPDELTFFLNLRGSDIERFVDRCKSRGAVFITEPKTHARERRCYTRDLDGYMIEVGQTTFTRTPLEMYR